VKNHAKAGESSANIEFTGLTLPGTVVIVEEFRGSEARSIGFGRWVVQTRYRRAITPEDSSQQSVLIFY
jgi:hypothetical protein